MPTGSVVDEEADTTLTPTWDFNDAAQANDFTVGTGNGTVDFNGSTLKTKGSADTSRKITLNRNLKNIKSISFDMISYSDSGRFWGGVNLYDGITNFNILLGSRRTNQTNLYTQHGEILITGVSDVPREATALSKPA